MPPLWQAFYILKAYYMALKEKVLNKLVLMRC